MAMDSSTARSHITQEIGSQTLESMLIPTKTQAEKKTKPADQEALKCPRCDSSNTKFCYYNNYSLSQPRYFCKSCRRYWTKGGTLRNVPVGGGCRKTKRSSSSKIKGHDQPILTARIPSPINPNSYINSPLSYDSTVFTPGSSHLPFDSGFSVSRNPNMPAAAFLETPLGFQSVYYGVGDGGVNLGLEMNGGLGMSGLNHEMGLMGFEDLTSSANVKQENCSADFGKLGDHNHGEISRSGLWGFAWQNGDGNIGSWNGIGSSNWHGLLNTPLM